ncbi:hypothetical protein [Streptomyces sp. NPDC001978]|uniref:hypothetical protein n=1 Tax=Streptomyces sp. NPDC001978 TaxID=3364627 RepID=UPI0036B98832
MARTPLLNPKENSPARTPRTRRLAILTASAALAAGGALIPTTAFAAPASAHAGTVVTQTSQQQVGAVNGYGGDDYCWDDDDCWDDDYCWDDYCWDDDYWE